MTLGAFADTWFPNGTVSSPNTAVEGNPNAGSYQPVRPLSLHQPLSPSYSVPFPRTASYSVPCLRASSQPGWLLQRCHMPYPMCRLMRVTSAGQCILRVYTWTVTCMHGFQKAKGGSHIDKHMICAGVGCLAAFCPATGRSGVTSSW